MSGRGSPIDQVHQHRTLQTEDRNRLAAIMQTTLNAMGPLRDVRPSQDEDAAMFPTPGNSPPYTTNDGGACFPAQADLTCQYPQPGLNGMNMTAVAVSNAAQYIPAPRSPADEAYYHAQSSPYSPPYDDISSPHSMACSPHSNVSCSPIACTGANFEPYITAPPPPVDSLAACSMASTGVSLPPITTIPLTTTTSLHFPTELDNQKSVVYTTAPPAPNYYPPISQTGAWPQPPHLTRFNEPGFVPPHSAAMICTQVTDGGEVPINVIEQPGFPDADPITYYPLTPESPESRQAAYACHAEFAAMQKPGLYLPPGALCSPFSAHVKSAPNKPPKRKRPQKPAVQVDDTEIKDIPTSAQLWEFTLRVLKKPKYHYMVNWENKKEGLFRFHDAQAFAALWGKHRNRPNMTYDKVARALRYYYKRDILNQVGGRLTYRFSKRLSKLYMTDE